MSQWYPCSSSNIRRFKYDTDDALLTIEFKNSGVYEYHEVPEPIFIAFLNSESKGKYFHANIKDQFETVKTA